MIKFSEFFNVLYASCNNKEDRSEYVETLFDNILAAPRTLEDSQKFTEGEYNPFTYLTPGSKRSIANGTRRISKKTASYILSHLDRATFSEYILGFSDDARESICVELSMNYGVANTNIDDIGDICADLLIEILHDIVKTTNKREKEDDHENDVLPSAKVIVEQVCHRTANSNIKQWFGPLFSIMASKVMIEEQNQEVNFGVFCSELISNNGYVNNAYIFGIGKYDTLLVLSGLYCYYQESTSLGICPILIDSDEVFFESGRKRLRENKEIHVALSNIIDIALQGTDERKQSGYLVLLYFGDYLSEGEITKHLKEIQSIISSRLSNVHFIIGISGNELSDGDCPFFCSSLPSYAKVWLTAIDIRDTKRFSSILDYAESLFYIDSTRVEKFCKQCKIPKIDIGMALIVGKTLGTYNDQQVTEYECMLSFCKDCLGISDLSCTANTAFHYFYNATQGHYDESSYDFVVSFHPFLVYFLLAYFFFEKLSTLSETKHDYVYFSNVFPKNVTRLMVSQINSSQKYMESIISFASNQEQFDALSIWGKDGICYLLGRITGTPHYSYLAEQILVKLYKQYHSVYMSGRVSDSERNAYLLFVRGLAIGLIYMGKEEIAKEYINDLLSDSTVNRINRSYHLEYYEDIPTTNKMSLSFEDDKAVGKKTLDSLCRNIEMNINTSQPILYVDLFTLCSLLQQRIGNVETVCNLDIKTYVERCLWYISYLSTGKSDRITRFDNSKVRVYFALIERTFNAFLRNGMQASALCILADSVLTLGNGTVPTKTRIGGDGVNNTSQVQDVWFLGLMLLPDISSQSSSYDKDLVLKMLLLQEVSDHLTPEVKAILGENATKTDDFMRMLLLFDTFSENICLSSYYDIWEDYSNVTSYSASAARDFVFLVKMYRKLCSCVDQPERFTEMDREILQNAVDRITSIEVRAIYELLIKKNQCFRMMLNS